MITASLVKELREKSGAGMLYCKKALEENNGNIEAAMDWLREKGISKAAKKADRIAAEGTAAILVDGNTAAIVEVNSETDFVAKNPEFTEMVDSILKAIVAGDPKTEEDVLAVALFPQVAPKFLEYKYNKTIEEKNEDKIKFISVTM